MPEELWAVWRAWWRLPAAILALVLVGVALLCAFFHIVAYHGNCSMEPSQLWHARLAGSLCLEPHRLPDLASLTLGSPKLPRARASFAAPLSCILDWRANTLSVDIPVQPNVCRLQAVLSRARSDAWGEIRLSAVAHTARAAAHPLLTCRLVADGPPRAASPSSADAAPQPPMLEEESEGEAGKAKPGDLEVYNSDGMTGCIREQGEGKYIFTQERKGKNTFNEVEPLTYSIESHPELNWISISRQDGHQLALASRRLSGRLSAEHLQVDVEPGTDSPESALLLMCVLAMVAFGAQ